eukprot:jgi/Botrbrau1/8555/Bobra.0359s0019.1
MSRIMRIQEMHPARHQSLIGSHGLEPPGLSTCRRRTAKRSMRGSSERRAHASADLRRGGSASFMEREAPPNQLQVLERRRPWLPSPQQSSLLESPPAPTPRGLDAGVRVPGVPLPQETEPEAVAVLEHTLHDLRVAAIALAAFGVIAWDVNARDSPHWLVQHVDAPVQAAVAQSLPSQWWVTEGLLSDLSIVGSVLIMGLVSFELLLQGSKWKGLLGAWGLVLLMVGGDFTCREMHVVYLLKSIFRRVRPSELHHTFSFPSGHTTHAVFLAGAALFLFVPLLLASYREAESAGNVDWAAEGRGTGAPFWEALYRNALPLWAAAGLTTAVGRVLGNVHWVSDTLAGAFLAVGLVSAVSHLHKRLS